MALQPTLTEQAATEYAVNAAAIAVRIGESIGDIIKAVGSDAAISGFPGLWQYAAQAGIKFAEAQGDFAEDQYDYPGAISDYSEFLVRHLLEGRVVALCAATPRYYIQRNFY